MEPKTSPGYAEARNFYLNTDLPLQDIAKIVGVNRRTLYRWMKDGAWAAAKYAASHAPITLAEGYYHQLAKLNEAIAAREQPWPTKEESEIIRRLSATIRNINPQGRPTISQTLTVFESLTDTIRRKERDPEALRWIAPYLDLHLQGLVQAGNGTLNGF